MGTSCSSQAMDFHYMIYNGEVEKIKSLLALSTPDHVSFLVNCDPGPNFHIKTVDPLYTCCAYRFYQKGKWNTISSASQLPDDASSPQYQIAKLLVENYADKIKFEKKVGRDHHFQNAFHLACQCLDLPMIKLFLKHNYPLSQQNLRGFTPFAALCEAASTMHQRFLTELLARQKDRIACSPEEVENRSKLVHLCVIEFLAEAKDFFPGQRKSINSSQSLVDNHNPPQPPPLAVNTEATPIHILARGGFWEAISELFTAGAFSVFKLDNYNQSATATVMNLMTRWTKVFTPDVEADFARKRYLQTLRLLLAQERKEMAQTGGAKEYQEKYFFKMVHDTRLRYSQFLLSDEDIEKNESNTLLFEFVVNQGFTSFIGYPLLFCESVGGETNVSLANAEKLFGKDNGYYSKLCVVSQNDRKQMKNRKQQSYETDTDSDCDV